MFGWTIKFEPSRGTWRQCVICSSRVSSSNEDSICVECFEAGMAAKKRKIEESEDHRESMGKGSKGGLPYEGGKGGGGKGDGNAPVPRATAATGSGQVVGGEAPPLMEGLAELGAEEVAEVVLPM